VRRAGPLELWRTDGLLIAFPVIAYGFTAHQFLFNIYATLRVPSVKRMVGVVHHVRKRQPFGSALAELSA
jgi:amino acid permease